MFTDMVSYTALIQADEVAAVDKRDRYIRAIDAGYEGIVVPAATRFQGYNLVVVPDHLHPGSALRIRDYEEPQLYQGP